MSLYMLGVSSQEGQESQALVPRLKFFASENYSGSLPLSYIHYIGDENSLIIFLVLRIDSSVSIESCRLVLLLRKFWKPVSIDNASALPLP